ncbi:MAG: O-acetyl-ADP-ribose deacetylase [Haliea sp.]|jgi:O-acetyl-ADP-ribose deacetylase (regulator of RNase III)|nr:O-acetyl-ADP-ribose deacetylase [Haliea sp.]
MSHVTLLIGDITTAPVDAIVNAANSALQRGGGVCGAIHAAAGPELQRACDRVEPVDGVRCPIGEARLTEAGNLPAKYVIHAVGPRYQIDTPSEALLTSAYQHSYRLALEHGCRTVAVPAISCGIFGYPLEEAAQVALTASLDADFSELDIRFYLFDQGIHDVFDAVLRQLLAV